MASELTFHPIANVFPLIEGAEFDALVADIREQGLRNTITLYEGMILDGRNRYRACLVAEVAPRYEEFDGDDPIAFVVSENIHRRHLNETQRGMCAARLANIEHGANRYTLDASIEASISQPEAAERFNVSRATVQRCQKVIEEGTPELIAACNRGEMAASKAVQQIEREKRQKKNEEAAAKVMKAAKKNLADVCDLRLCPMDELLADTSGIDALITDPPYPEEFLPVYGQMARLATKVALVAVMCGQTYLPRIMADMSEHLEYRWTLAYLTPGGQAVQMFPRKVNTFWKPVLLFGTAAEWLGDVCKSDTNDNDKDHHKWGQSESGMADLVKRLTKPGQTICDPFLGGGTTAMVAIKLGRKFVGCDTDSGCIKKTWERLALLYGASAA